MTRPRPDGTYRSAGRAEVAPVPAVMLAKVREAVAAHADDEPVPPSDITASEAPQALVGGEAVAPRKRSGDYPKQIMAEAFRAAIDRSKIA